MADRLDSWKAIAAYLGRDVRTVQRWAASRSLPVHRVPGGAKPRVFAQKSEIEEWLGAGSRHGAAETPSIAVLPFADLRGDQQNQYFGDGLADDIINSLTCIPGLRVTARTSSFAFRRREGDVRQIGMRLGAATLLEGSVRREGDRVRVSAQLVDTRDGYHLWSECYDRRMADIFAIQDDIANAIAAALKLRLLPQPPRKRPTEDMHAYELWLKGRAIGARLTPEAFTQALECYAAAAARDPRFALPYVDRADALLQAAMFGMTPSPDAARHAHDAVLQALELDDSLGEAHAVRASLQGVTEYDWPGAERSFQRALELCPGSAAVLWRHATFWLEPQGKTGEAVAESREAAARDPLSPLTHTLHGFALFLAREYGAAETECRLAVELAPGLWFPHWFLGISLLMGGRPSEGFAHCQTAYEHFPHEPLAIGGMCSLYGMFSRPTEARQMLSQLEDLARTSYVPPLAFAWAYVGLVDDRVFEWLDKAIDARDPAVIHLPSLPIYDRIRQDPRFSALLARMRLGGDPSAEGLLQQNP